MGSIGLAGKIHDVIVHKETLDDNSQDDDSRPLYRNSVRVNNRHTKKSRYVAIPDTDAYCTRFELWALVHHTKKYQEWVWIGTYMGCQNAHTERIVSLTKTSSVLCSRKCGHDSSSSLYGVECSALRFKALDWCRDPLMQVAAYGIDDSSNGDAESSSKVAGGDNPGTEDEDTNVLYTIKLPREFDM